MQLYNNCNDTIYSWTFGLSRELQSGMIQPQSWYSEPYYQYLWNGTGISIKLAAYNNMDTASLTLLEYSFNNSQICTI